jgi:hypothetical protein
MRDYWMNRFNIFYKIIGTVGQEVKAAITDQENYILLTICSIMN